MLFVLIIVLDQRQDLGHTPDDQAVPTEEGEPETGSLANGEESKVPEEPAETETHLPPQHFQPELLTDLPEEDEHKDEDENRVSEAAETGEDQDADGEEEVSPTDGYPTIEDNDPDSVSAYTEGETAVIGLNVLEAEVIDPPLAEDEQGDEASAPLYDGSEEGDETEPDNLHDTRQAGGSQVADGQDGVDQEFEKGAEFLHEHLEYAEPDAESGTPFLSLLCFTYSTSRSRTHS